MKPSLGWTMLSRKEMQQVERSLANSEQDTRDEIGFLLLHQGFADRFFPGTSVLHTRIRYVLFVPWLYLRAVRSRKRGSTVDATVRGMLIELARRLKDLGREPTGVIGGEKLGQLTSQPPDLVYWSAMRRWGLLLPTVESRVEALRRLQGSHVTQARDDDGGPLDDAATEVFSGLPTEPTRWESPDEPLTFKLTPNERAFLRKKLSLVLRPNDSAPSLLAKLATADVSFANTSVALPTEIDTHADESDKNALPVARDAAALSAIGRAVYGALVERLIADDGGEAHDTHRQVLKKHFATYGVAAARCDLTEVERLIPGLPPHVRDVLTETREFVRAGDPANFARLHSIYQTAEVRRKSSRRARLAETVLGAERRSDWRPLRHNTSPLHYRWNIVRDMLADLDNDQ
jgi:hypothetical protein